MFIKNITLNKKNFIIDFDNDENLIISEDTLVKFNLYKGLEVEDNFPEFLYHEDEKSRALTLSYRFLERVKTKKQLIDYLYNHKIDFNIINEIIPILEDKNYLNDIDYAYRYLNDAQNIKKYGKLKIIYMLKSKGIDNKIIDDIMLEYDYELEYENAKELLEKKMDLIKENYDFKKINSTKRYLISRGFEYNTISNIFGDLNEI